MFQAFGLASASVYPNDLGGTAAVQEAVGHIEHSRPGQIDFPASAPLKLLKTHEQPTDSRRAIYVIRDGVEAVSSLFEFWNGKVSLEAIIRGRRFGTWSQHLQQWRPDVRADTLLLRYETMCSDLPACIDMIEDFIGVVPIARNIPARSELSEIGARWIKLGHDARPAFSSDELKLFTDLNGAAMQRYGYPICA